MCSKLIRRRGFRKKAMTVSENNKELGFSSWAELFRLVGLAEDQMKIEKSQDKLRNRSHRSSFKDLFCRESFPLGKRIIRSRFSHHFFLFVMMDQQKYPRAAAHYQLSALPFSHFVLREEEEKFIHETRVYIGLFEGHLLPVRHSILIIIFFFFSVLGACFSTAAPLIITRLQQSSPTIISYSEFD